MATDQTRINRLSAHLGFWSALLSAVAFIVFTACFTAILVLYPVIPWTDMSDYVGRFHSRNHLFQYVAQAMMLAFGPLFVILLNCIHDYARDDRKVLSRIALCFGVAFATLVCVGYFFQLTVVRLNLSSGHLDGVEQLIQTNPNSTVLAIMMLGWGWFFALSSLFVAPVFSGGALERVIKFSFLANGVFCILGALGYAFDLVLLVSLCLNLGMGAAVMVATIALSILFRRLLATNNAAGPLA
jgi:hypothetical protein